MKRLFTYLVLLISSYMNCNAIERIASVEADFFRWEVSNDYVLLWDNVSDTSFKQVEVIPIDNSGQKFPIRLNDWDIQHIRIFDSNLYIRSYREDVGIVLLVVSIEDPTNPTVIQMIQNLSIAG